MQVKSSGELAHGDAIVIEQNVKHLRSQDFVVAHGMVVVKGYDKEKQ